MHCQNEPLPILWRKKIVNIKTNYFDTKDSIPIERGKDQPLQSKQHLVCAIVSLWNIKRKLAKPNLSRIMAIATKFWAPLPL